ncbi:hypothetical protein [Streptomyces sp. JJ38]|uniref:hypothetical protein n=1 Tax=Streptomyces sp. JJ38 TaxID=2738128 RepID=UPI001C59BBF7|nr:hypothetical protein [Streptomyces sp. JJ38]MBW1599549.1 hypothetical protein [Streptomyces sp. JJ38]
MSVETPLLLIAFAGFGIGFAGALYGLRRRRARRDGGSGGDAFRAPLAVVPSAEREEVDRLRQEAHDEILALSRVIKEFGLPLPASPLDGDGPAGTVYSHPERPERVSGSHDGLQRALDAYAAAATVLDAARSRADVVGALVLVAEGQDALTEARNAVEGRTPGVRPRVPACFFHPLHGQALRTVAWRVTGSTRSLDVRVCQQCAWDISYRRPPEVLTEELGGRVVPYFQVPAEQSLWAATGFGSLIGGRLAERVLRGDFTRARMAALESDGGAAG